MYDHLRLRTVRVCFEVAFGGEMCHFFGETRHFSQAKSGRYGQEKKRSLPDIVIYQQKKGIFPPKGWPPSKSIGELIYLRFLRSTKKRSSSISSYIKTSLALLPSDGPTIPTASSWSIIRPARL